MIELLKEQKQVIINDAVTGKIVIKDEGGRLKAEKDPTHPSSLILHHFFKRCREGGRCYLLEDAQKWLKQEALLQAHQITISPKMVLIGTHPAIL